MKEQIQKQSIEIMISHTIVALCIKILFGYSLWKSILILYFFGMVIAGSMWLSERYEKPIIWQFIMIVFCGVGANFIFNQGIGEFLFDESELMESCKKISELFFISLLLVTVIGRKELGERIKKRIDCWFPPMWSIAIAIGVILLRDGKQDITIRRLSIVVFALILFVTMSTKNIKRSNQKIQFHVKSRGYLGVMAVLSMVILGISLVLPLAHSLPYTNEVVHLVEELTHWENIETNELRLSRYPDTSNEEVLTVKGEGPLYLRRLAYKTYEKGMWYLSDEINRGWTSISASPDEQTYLAFRQMLYDIASKKIEVPDLAESYQEILAKPIGVDQLLEATVEEKQAPRSYLTVNGIYKLESDNNQERNFGYNGTQEDLFVINDTNSLDKEYKIYYNHYLLGENTRERLAFEEMDFNDYVNFISQVTLGLTHKMDELEEEMSSEQDENAKEKLSQEIEDCKYKINTYEKTLREYSRIKDEYTSVPEELTGLLQGYVKIVTAGCESDYAKCQAICDKLKNCGEYIYQIGASYTDQRNDPVIDFLLYGKAGVCQDFASAMVLLCRSVGISARYVEGYYAKELNADKRYDEQTGYTPEYIVRKKDSHAFVEAYIVGYGWMLFDPTTSNETFMGEGETGEKQGLSKMIERSKSKTRVWGYYVFILVVIVLTFRPIRIRLWGIWISRKPPSEVLGLLIEKSLACLERKGMGKKEGETLSEYTSRLQEKEIEIGIITECYEAYLYGNQRPSLKELREAYSCYLDLNKRKRHKANDKEAEDENVKEARKEVVVGIEEETVEENI